MNTAPPDVRRVNEPAVARPPTPARVGPPAPSGRRTPWWVWLMIVVIVAAGTFTVIHFVKAARANSADAAAGRKGGGRDQPVVVANVRRGDLPVYLYGLGTVTPLKTVNVKSRVDGAITLINYTEGQHVKAGDFLVQIDPRPYQAALDQAKGQLAKDQATLDSAKWNVEQDQIAIKTNAIAQQQLHTDTATRDSAQGAIEVDQANIEAAQVNLAYCHITSPIDGVAGLRQVDLGNIVHASDTTSLVVITQEQPITVVFTLAEDQLEQLHQRVASGQAVRVDAYDRTLTRRLARGSVLALDNVIDPTTGTVRVKAQFDNADLAMGPGQFVNARVLADTVRQAVLVPSAAIQHGATGNTFVYVAEGDDPKQKTVKIRPVTEGERLSAVGPDEADTTVIASGLEPGEVVVTDGVDKLADGTKVSPRLADVRHRGATQPTTGSAAATTMPTDETGTVVGAAAATQPATGGPHGHRRHGGGPAAAPAGG